jgi:ribonucleoside-triphosphate reductase
MERFELKKEFIDQYKSIKPPFGFNGLGEIVYLRTYSRLNADGKSEQWFETVERVVNGVYNLQKEHILTNTLGWDEDKAHESAEEMYDRMFNMKFIPSGRSLWAMGTPLITEKKMFAALNACSFVSTKDIDKEFSKPFEYMIDMAMLGVGVGFDTKGAGRITILKPLEDDFFFQIPDSREGWTESLKHLLNAFFKGYALPKFDYSLLRAEGEIIKTFGGKSSGPQPLKDMHNEITNKLTKSIGKPISITNIVDIMNLIGVCVVAGNIRKSAQIAFGDTSEEYLKLKDYKWDSSIEAYVGSNVERSRYGWSSNNTVITTVGMDYTKLAEQTSLNGEPGYFWLENAQQFGRMYDPIDNKDLRALGGNPCLEQTLEPYEMCCLVETFPNSHANAQDYHRTLKYAYLFAKTVTLGQCHWPETNRVQLRNRRIGTSVSGIAQFLESHSINELKEWLHSGYETIRKYDDIYSEWLAIPRSIKVTSVKPSGTVSLLAGATPGMHFPESNYYIRRVRFAKSSDLLAPLVASGYKVEEAQDNPETTVVVEIPIFANSSKTINQITLWEQLLLAAFLQEHWADNQVSCTVTFKKWEKDQIKTALDYFQYKLKGVSFLPKIDSLSYKQMPYEEITKEQYDDLVKNIRPFDTKEIAKDSRPELFCNNESCIYV